MTATDHPIREINAANPPDPLSDDARALISALAKRQKAANGLLMQMVTFVGGQVEDGLKLLPTKTRGQIEGAVRSALESSFDVAAKSRRNTMLGRAVQGDRVHKIIAAMSGAIGGLGGLPTALAELPVATTVIYRAVQGVAEAHGEDPEQIETRVECLRVFAAGADSDEDSIDFAFHGARMGLTGAAVNTMISRIAPRFATILSQKLAAQTIPILGAAAGAGTNFAFTGYYTEMAHVHFGLRALARDHGDEAVHSAFHAAVVAGKITFKEKA